MYIPLEWPECHVYGQPVMTCNNFFPRLVSFIDQVLEEKVSSESSFHQVGKLSCFYLI